MIEPNEKTKLFIEKAIKIHGDKYDYSKVVYTNNSTKISCPHCTKIGQLTNMKRWHFDNCKSNPKGSDSNDQKV